MKRLVVALATVLAICLPAIATAAVVPVFGLPSIEQILVANVGPESAILLWVALAVGVWTHLRANLPAAWLARLPTWLISLLDFIAGNYRHSKNDIDADPKRAKQLQ